MLQATHSQSTSSDGTGSLSVTKSQLDQIAKKLISTTLSKDDEKDLEEEFDAASDAMEQAERQKAEEEQMVKSLPSDPTASAVDDEKEQIENEEEEEEEEEESAGSSSIDSLDEEAVISSRSFAKEFESAIDHISDIAKSHRAEMIESIVKRMEEETGQFVSDEMVSSAMRPFAVQQIESMDISSTTDEESAVSAEEEEDDVDGDDDDSLSVDEEVEEPTAAESQQILRSSSCWIEALESVRSLGREDQEEFVNSLCSIHCELNDEEPTIEELHSMFSGIRARFEEEAMSLSESEDDSVEEVDAESFAEEMESALAAVRKQAQLDQEGLVSFIADYFHSVNGSEPSVEEVAGVLGRIKEQFHAECRSLFLEQNEDDDADSDLNSEYEPEDDQAAEQYAEDEAEDIYIEGEHEAVSFSEFSSSELVENVEYDPMDDDAQSLYSRDELDDEELSVFASASASEFEEETEDEDDIVNSAHFAVEWHEALQSVHDLAKSDQQRLMLSVDELATDSMVEAAMESLKEAVFDYDSGDDLEEEEALDLEMRSALQSVSELGAVHGEALALRVSELYHEENGQEISVQELAAIFSEVQDCFAEEAVSSDDEEGEVDGQEFADLYSEAMDHVVEIAKCHREEVVAKFAQIYDEINCNPPTKGAIVEMMECVVESFADEAMDELLDDDLDLIRPTESEDDDSSYSPESDIADHSDYQFDALDLALYFHSFSDHESDADFDADHDAEDLKELYAEDGDLDLADSDSSESELNENEEEELKQSEVGSDSEYSPDKDGARYFSDYQAEYASSSSSRADHDQSDSASSAESEDADYNPDYDLFDYSRDSQSGLQSESRSGSEQSLRSESEAESDSADGSQSEEEKEEEEEEESDDDDDDYLEEADSAEYAQDEFEEYSGDEAEDDDQDDV